MRPICVPCERFMRCKKNDYTFIESASDGKPDKLWAGDLYECPGCHQQAIGGVAREPIAEYFEPHFNDTVARYSPALVVKDI